MNQFQKAFLQGGFALLHCNLLVNDVYDKNDIYSSKADFKNMIRGCKKLHDGNEEMAKIELSQFEYGKCDTLIVIGKLLEKIDIKTLKGTQTLSATDSVANRRRKIAFSLIDLDYSNGIKELKLYFKNNIIDPLLISVSTEVAEKVEEPVIIPEITSTFSLGESLVNIKFKGLPDKYQELIVNLYDSQNDLLGVFRLKEGMNFLAITDLAFDKYNYQVIAKNEGDILAKSKLIEFALNRPNYGGKPTRGSR